VSRPLDPRLLHALPVVRRLLRTLCCLQVLGALLTVAQAALLADLVVAVVLQGQHGGPLAPRLVLLVAAMGGRAGVAAAQEWVAARASSQTRPDLRRAVLTAVTRLGPTWAGRQPAGRLVTAAGPGLEAMDGYLTLAVPALTAAAVVPVVVLATIAVTDWQSALVLVVTLPLVPLFMVLVGATTRRRMQAQYETLARLAGHFLDLVQGLTTLKVYGQAHRQVEAVRRATDAYRVQTMQTLRVALLSGLVLDLLATLSVAVVAVDVGLRLDAGHLTLRPALLVLLLAPELFAPLRAMGAQHHDSEQGRVASAMALDVLDQARALPVAEQLRCSRPAGMVRVRALHVAHAGRSHPALDGVDLDISPGTVVVLQGPSGGGKSTLLAVLLGLVEPTSGSILVGDKDLRELDPALWRAGTAWAPQRPHTTQPTVAEEVLLGDPAATRPQLLAALTDCRALSPETRLGEDGTHISTGQRRRVAVARALLRARAVRAAGGVPLVLLDEPSEDLDLDTERVVAAVISRLAGWATVLVATHSPRLAGLGDRRVELRDGQVVSDVAQCRETQGPEMQGPEMQGPEMQGLVRRGYPGRGCKLLLLSHPRPVRCATWSPRWPPSDRRGPVDGWSAQACWPAASACPDWRCSRRRSGSSPAPPSTRRFRRLPWPSSAYGGSPWPGRCSGTSSGSSAMTPRCTCWPTCGRGSSPPCTRLPLPASRSCAAVTCCAASSPTSTAHRTRWCGPQFRSWVR